MSDELYEHLKHSANMYHRSINSELIACLERVLLPAKTTPADFKEAARTLRKRLGPAKFDAAEIDSAKREGRA
jgi:hypothetical protein